MEPTTVQELAMLIGDKVIMIYERDKEIMKLNEQLASLHNEKVELEKRIEETGRFIDMRKEA